jgi:hypothetical protein
MKKFFSFLLSLAFAGSTFAQMSGYSSSNYSDGTTLGANETLTADGIALGNAVKLRGYVDFMYGYSDWSEGLEEDKRFNTNADVDFLFDFSPITAEVHLNATEGELVEQAFGRYSLTDEFNIQFGRQVTPLGYEGDEAPLLKTVSTAYFTDVALGSDAIQAAYIEEFTADYTLTVASLATALGNGTITSEQYTAGVLAATNDLALLTSLVQNLKLRKNYVDGVRLNYNNGMFGFTFGLHDGYWGAEDHFNDNMAIDLAASVMFFPGLEARLGYAHQDMDYLEIDHVNGWIEYNPGDLTLAFEFDSFDLSDDSSIFDIMLLANYQFSDFFGATLRYSHENVDELLGELDYDSNRITLAALFTITNHFGINVEYSHTELDGDGWDDSADEFYVEGLITY